MTPLTLSSSSCVQVQPDLCCPTPLPSLPGPVVLKDTARPLGLALSPLRANPAPDLVLRLPLSQDPWLPPPPCPRTLSPEVSFDAIELPDHDVVSEGVAHIQAHLPDFLRVKPGPLLHSLWAGPGMGKVGSEVWNPDQLTQLPQQSGHCRLNKNVFCRYHSFACFRKLEGLQGCPGLSLCPAALGRSPSQRIINLWLLQGPDAQASPRHRPGHQGGPPPPPGASPG